MAHKTVTIQRAAHGAVVMTVKHRGETVLIHNAAEYLQAQQTVCTDDVDVVVAVAMCMALAIRTWDSGVPHRVGLLARVNTVTGDADLQVLQ